MVKASTYNTLCELNYSILNSLYEEHPKLLSGLKSYVKMISGDIYWCILLKKKDTGLSNLQSLHEKWFYTITRKNQWS